MKSEKVNYWSKVSLVSYTVGLHIALFLSAIGIPSAFPVYLLSLIAFFAYNIGSIILYQLYIMAKCEYSTTINIDKSQTNIYKRKNGDFLLFSPSNQTLLKIQNGTQVHIGPLFLSWFQQSRIIEVNKQELYQFLSRTSKIDEAIKNSSNKQKLTEIIKRNKAVDSL